MKRRLIPIGVLALLLVVALAASACGGGTTTTSGATTTTAPSTETSGPTTTGAVTTTASTTGGTETTAASSPATGEPILIGLSNSLTGSGAAPGGSLHNGVALQVETINNNGGINGRPLKVIEMDDKSDVPTALANLAKMIESDKVVATIGPCVQYIQDPARGIAEKYQTPMVGAGPAVLADFKTNKYNWSVMTAAAAPVQEDALKKLIAAEGWKNILSIADVLTIHNEELDLLVQDAPKNGFQITKMKDTFGFDQTDFQPILNKIMEQYKALKPDAVFLMVNPVALPVLYKGLRTLGVTVPIQGSPAAAHPAIFSQGPQAVEGFLTLDSGGLTNPQSLPDDWPVKSMQLAFFQAYKAKFNSDPDFFSAVGADLVSTLAEAMKQAGGPDDKEKVRQALVNLKDFKTLEGVLTFTPDATSMGIHGGMVEMQVKNGQFLFVKALN
jgi:branched-chain amino acid transport system substrate-binding protein